MEKMTSEPEETPAAPNEEDQMSGDGQGTADRFTVSPDTNSPHFQKDARH